MKKGYFILFINFAYIFLGAQAYAVDNNLISFRIACTAPSPACAEATIANTGHKILVQKQPVITLEDIASASLSTQHVEFMTHAGAVMKQEENPALKLKFKDSQKLYDVTSQNMNEVLAIFIDNELVTAPKIRSPIPGGVVMISGPDMTQEKAKLLVDKINNATNPAHLANQ